jgi:glyoxylase-like metal-dependent hydrolase (beta-lactamase superfamily II)
MSDAVFHFDIGQFKCMAISDGTLTDQSAESSRPAQVHHLNCLFVDTGEHRVLVDTGCGEGFQSTAGRLLRNLEAAGIRREDIDRIILTHGHLDHVGGACDAAGLPVYPKARYLATKSEWDCWVDRPETSELQHMFFASARKNLLPVPGRFDLLEDDNADILPGIRAIPAPGHTPGLVMLEISSGEDRLLCVGDIIHSPIEFTQPEYYALFDVAPEQAVRTRTEVLSDAAQSGALIFACHFAFPGIGHIVKKGGLFHWQPLAP